MREAYRSRGFAAEVSGYIDDMASAYREADLVLSRAGATTVAEVTACGRPAILIPFPAAAHGHQEKNAAALESAGAARMILERDLSGASLAAALNDLLDTPGALEGMASKSRELGRPDAGRKAAALGLSLAEKVLKREKRV